MGYLEVVVGTGTEKEVEIEDVERFRFREKNLEQSERERIFKNVDTACRVGYCSRQFAIAKLGRAGSWGS